MNSPNTRVSVGLKSNLSSTVKSTYPTRKFVTIGSKDPVSTTIITMAPPSGKSYARKHSFDTLVTAIRTHSNAFPPSDLINVITSEMPIDTAAALQSAHNICSAILTAPYHTSNLQPLSFLTRDGHPITITNDFDSNRPDDVFYVSFNCCINGKSIDPRISQPTHSFTFCLRLPQTTQVSSANPNNTGTNLFDTPPQKAVMDDVETNINSLLAEIMSSNNDSPDSPAGSNALLQKVKATLEKVKNTAPPPQSNTTSMSPKMLKMLDTSKNSVTSYFGPLNFADDDLTFISVFGNSPPLLKITKRTKGNAAQNIEDNESITKSLLKFFEKCKLDVFIELIKLDYVGDSSSIDSTKAVKEITSAIQKLKMQYQPKPGLTRTISPSDLYSSYLQLVPSLPEDPSIWNLVLCVTFFDALTQDLKDKMATNKFIMPTLQHLVTKDDHLNALWIVCEAACNSYDDLQQEETRISNLLAKQGHFKSMGRVSVTTVGDNSSISSSHHNTDASSLLAYHPNLSQAETTLQHYSPSNSAGINTNIPTVTLNDGQSYPCDPQDPSIISDFPITFRGCYCCGQTDHHQFRDVCPLRNDPGAREKFFKNLHLHKPHTKKFDRRSPDNASAATVSNATSGGSVATMQQQIAALQAQVNAYQTAPNDTNPAVPKSILHSSPDIESQVTWDASVVSNCHLIFLFPISSTTSNTISGTKPTRFTIFCNKCNSHYRSLCYTQSYHIYIFNSATIATTK
jgi:hypothetical protein